MRNMPINASPIKGPGTARQIEVSKSTAPARHQPDAPRRCQARRSASDSSGSADIWLADLNKTASYKLRVMYLSHNESRAQSLFVNGRELHGKLALPKQQIVCRDFDLPGSEVGELPVEAVQTNIAVDDRVVDTAIPFKMFIPANGGFGMKIEGSGKEQLPR